MLQLAINPPIHLPSLSAVYVKALGEGPMAQSSEDRLFDMLDEINTKLNGNGSPGAFTRLRAVEKYIESQEEQRRNSRWKQFGMGVLLCLATILLNGVWGNYINKTPSPVDKKLAATVVETKTEEDQRFEDFKDRVLQEIRDRLPAKPPIKKPVAAKPQVRHKAMLREYITTRDHEPSRLSYNRTPSNEMRIP